MCYFNKLCLSCKKACKQYIFVKLIECFDYNHNGTPYKNKPETIKELTSGQKRKIQKLVVSMCANYSHHYDICLPLDSTCLMINKSTINSRICKYFKQAVMPLDSKLEAVFLGTNVNMVNCFICQNEFIRKSNQIYCSAKCRKAGNNLKSRKRMNKYRKNKE